MRVFVTGATGWVGSAVVPELTAAGHQVLGLCRTEGKAAALAATGAKVLPGSLADLDLLREAAASADAVVHTGFNHDFSRFAANCELDRAAILAMGDALAGSGRPLLVTAGLIVAPGRLATEQDPPMPPNATMPRVSETTANALVSRGVRAGTVRLPPSVHGHGDHGFVPILVDLARRTGVSAHVGDGGNRWPAVHRLDAARVFRLAVEAGGHGGPYHAVAETGVPFRDIAAVIGRRLGVPTVSLSGDEAAAHFGWFLHFATADVPASSTYTRAALGWTPTGPGLLADLDDDAYFA